MTIRSLCTLLHPLIYLIKQNIDIILSTYLPIFNTLFPSILLDWESLLSNNWFQSMHFIFVLSTILRVLFHFLFDWVYSFHLLVWHSLLYKPVLLPCTVCICINGSINILEQVHENLMLLLELLIFL